VFTASFDNTVATWHLDSGQQKQLFVGHIAAVFSVSFNLELDILVTGSADSTVKVWQLSTGQVVKTLTEQNWSWVINVEVYHFSDSGYYSILSRDNANIYLCKLSVENHSLLSRKQFHEHLAFNMLPIPGLHVSQSQFRFACTTSDTRATFAYVFCSGFDNESKTTVSTKYSGPCPMSYYLGGGDHFNIFLLPYTNHSNLKGVGVPTPRMNIFHQTGALVASINIDGDYRPSKRGSTFTLGDMSWLDGFSTTPPEGLLFASSLKQNNISMVKWTNSTNNIKETTAIQSAY